MLDSAIHWIKIYPVDNAIGFPNTYPLDSDLYAVDSAIQRLNRRQVLEIRAQERTRRAGASGYARGEVVPAREASRSIFFDPLLLPSRVSHACPVISRALLSNACYAT